MTASAQQRLATFLPSSDYPEPVIVPPRQLPHKHSFIFLHGRGDNAKNFAFMLLAMEVPGIGTLPEAFPRARFVFPSAAPRRAKTFKRIPISQWFDILSINKQEEEQELQIDGLKETSEWIHILMLREIERVGADNVVLGGLSQGCAASLIANILWDGPSIAGVIGMCGWLPLRPIMADSADMEVELGRLDAEREGKFEEQVKGEFKRQGLAESHQAGDRIDFVAPDDPTNREIQNSKASPNTPSEGDRRASRISRSTSDFS